MVTTTETTAKKKRDAGPMTIQYIGATDGKETFSSRVPAEPSGIKIIERKTGREKVYSITKMSDDVMIGLAVSGFKKTIETYARNNAGEDDSGVIEAADAIYEQLLEGKLYSRKNGTNGAARGPKFDFDFVIQVAKLTQKRTHNRDMTDREVEQFRDKLSSVTPADRKLKIASWKKNAVFMSSWKQLDAARAAKGLKAMGEVEELKFF